MVITEFLSLMMGTRTATVLSSYFRRRSELCRVGRKDSVPDDFATSPLMSLTRPVSAVSSTVNIPAAAACFVGYARTLPSAQLRRTGDP
jgi:hypothetical protein